MYFFLHTGYGYLLFWVNIRLPYDVASGSEITPCIKIDKPLVVYRFSANVMTSIRTLGTYNVMSKL